MERKEGATKEAPTCDTCEHWDYGGYQFVRGEYEVDGNDYGFCKRDQERKHYTDGCEHHMK